MFVLTSCTRSEADCNERNACDFARYGPEGTDKRQEQMGREDTSPGWKYTHISGKVHLLYDAGYVIPLRTQTYGKNNSYVCMYFPIAYE
jgi:hypothetical protein